MSAAVSEATLFIGSASTEKENEAIFINQLVKTEEAALTFSRSTILTEGRTPSHIAVSHSGKILYAVTESPNEADSRIYAWKLIDDEGNRLEIPARLGSWPIGGTGACEIVIHRNDRFIYVANYESGSISVFKDATKSGDLIRCNMFKFEGGSRVVPEKQDGAHIASVILSPNDDHIFFTDSGSDCIWKMGYSMLYGFEFITQLPEPFPAPEGSGPGRGVVALREDGPFLYIGCKFTNHLLVYWIDQDDFGNPEQIQFLPVIPAEDISDQQGDQGVTDVQLSADSRFLFVATHVRNAISVFEIDKEGNTNFIQWVECGGAVPRCILVVADWVMILVGSQRSKDLTAFLIDKDGGKVGGKVAINGEKRLELGYEPTELVRLFKI